VSNTRKSAVSLGEGSSVYQIGLQEFGWCKLEARRRGCSVTQVLRDACRAYRNLEKKSAAIPDVPGPRRKKYLPVDF
jgi:hypothetical protein